MARALKLAARGKFSARPNPCVGCVIVRGSDVLGEGFHARTGEAHAEVVALREAGDARGATVYVSLEPCAHHGRTGPCADALIEAGVARVVVAMEDPFPEVRGKGIARLRDAGIEAETGLLDAAARRLNEGFFKRVTTGRPLVRLKLGASLDGATAMRTGESQWITSSEARADVQRLRAGAGAVVTGIGTVLADDPRLTVRDRRFDVPEQPLRVVLDSDLRTPVTASVLREAGSTRIYHTGDNVRADLEEAGATLVKVREYQGRTDAEAVLDDLGAAGINDVLIEAGAELAGALATRGLIDEFIIYQAPVILGSETRPMLTTAWQRLSQGVQLDVVDRRMVGRDLKITARPASRQDDS